MSIRQPGKERIFARTLADSECEQPTAGDLRQKRMRSGPATRTAFASVNPASAFSHAFVRISSSLCSASAPPVQLRDAHPRTRRITHRSYSAVAVPLGGTVSEEAATPGLPATLARFGEPLQQLTRTAHLQNLPDPLGAGAFRLLQNHLLRSLAAQHSRLQ